MAEKTQNGANGGAMQVDVKLVRDLAKMLDATNLTEIEVADGERKIRVARMPGAQAMSYAPPHCRPARRSGCSGSDTRSACSRCPCRCAKVAHGRHGLSHARA